MILISLGVMKRQDIMQDLHQRYLIPIQDLLQEIQFRSASKDLSLVSALIIMQQIEIKF
jgi:hypothetical protein